MANEIVKIVMVGLFASLFVAVFLVGVINVNDSYGTSIETSNLSTFQKLDEFSDEIKETRNLTISESQVGTEQSESSFFTSAFTVGKFIFTGQFFGLVDGMMRDSFNLVGVPFFFYVALSAVIMLLVTYGIIKIITGRS